MKGFQPENQLDEELDWWINTWDTILRNGQYCNPDVPDLLNLDPTAETTYEERRWQEARAQVIRVLKETCIKDKNFFKGKIVLEIGPGAVGFLEACEAKIKIAVEPLAHAFRKHGLLLPGSDVIYLNTVAESIPLVDNLADIVLSRNNLDHVQDPGRTVDEIWRVLKPCGYFLLNVDIEHKKDSVHPHAFSHADVDAMLAQFQVEWKNIYNMCHGAEGRMYVALCVKTGEKRHEITE